MKDQKVLLHIVLYFSPKLLVFNPIKVINELRGIEYYNPAGNCIMASSSSGYEITGRTTEISAIYVEGHIMSRMQGSSIVFEPFLVGVLDQMKDAFEFFQGRCSEMGEYKGEELKIEFEQRVEGVMKIASFKLYYDID